MILPLNPPFVVDLYIYVIYNNIYIINIFFQDYSQPNMFMTPLQVRLAAAVRVVTLWKQAPLPEEGKKKLDTSRKLMQVEPDGSPAKWC